MARGMWGELGRRFWPSPDAERLLSAIETANTDLLSRQGADDAAGWAKAARDSLALARAHYEESKHQIAWHAVKAAERAMLCDPGNKAAALARAATLAREAEELPGRRGKAMQDLLLDADGKPDPQLADQPWRIAEAQRLRDDYFDTQYYRIDLRRRHLLMLCRILVCVLVALVVVVWFGAVEPFVATATPHYGWRLLTVVLLGVLGASLSVAQTIVSSDVNTKIAVQQVGAFMAWMRPAIGATAAVSAYVLMLANDKLQIFNLQLTNNFAVVSVIALVAGFSERFIVGALNRVAEQQGGDSKAPDPARPPG
jgi:hypothetical protein